MGNITEVYQALADAVGAPSAELAAQIENAVAATVAIVLSTLTGSSFAARLVLLVLWLILLWMYRRRLFLKI